MPAPVALITGAAHRLGARTAETLHGRGWNVVIHYRSRAEQAEQLVEKLNRERANSATSVQADLTRADNIANLARAASQHWERLDGLINNASVFYPRATEACTEDDWDDIMGANLKAPFFLLKHCLPELKKSNGSVINLIDIYSEKPLKDHPLYCASKAGLAALTRSWAKDLAPRIRVNGISPGAILWPEGDADIDPTHQQAILDKTPLARTGNPDDIAGAIAYLLCDAPFVTGQVLAIDGGRSLNM
ncbi:pteridine reductase [Marinobacter halophilus]|uniref:Pteridine reductase n=1 Tax=Marinobacter halophilus TaxID=1323740 RepID=A0A2T1KEH5_9GAMM|nr:pteridine reductase [Marinobacter halophilus]PSF08515.1 pteridine reductase [Marinobacter halophilus]GGC61266.1 pteridine reductase [Marinobacter halophilus]